MHRTRRETIAPNPITSLPEDSPTPKLILNVEALKVETFATAQVELLSVRPTTTGTWMNTNEPGCTLPEICGDTPRM